MTVNETLSWADYLRAIADSAVGAHIAAKTGIAESTVSRWLSNTNPPKPRQAVAVARAYGTNPIDALVAAGYLDPGDVQTAHERPRMLQLRDFSEVELAEEMLRRIVEGNSSLDEPIYKDSPIMDKFNK